MPGTSPDLAPTTPLRSSPVSSPLHTPASGAAYNPGSPAIPPPPLTVSSPIASSSSAPPFLIPLPLSPRPVATSSTSPPRFEAPPIPRKVGELNYVPPPPGTPLPRTPSGSTRGSPSTSSPGRAARLLHVLSPRSQRLSTAGSGETRKKKVHTVFGLHVTTLAFFIVVLLALPGTIAGWALAAMHFQSAPASSMTAATSGAIGATGNAGIVAAVVLSNGTAPVAAVIAPQMPSPLDASSNGTLPLNVTGTPGFNSTAFNTTDPGLSGGGVTPLAGNANATLGADGAGNSTTGSMSNADHDGTGSNGTSDGTGSAQAMLLSGVIFLHVAFAIGTILELLVLDRLLFQLIQQRRHHLRPTSIPVTAGSALGAVLHLGRFQSRGDGSDGMADAPVDEGPQSFLMRYAAPWNRGPLPSYRAAIGVREHGTGDVEDEVIVGPAPPEYGNTRGSVLLLQGALRRMASTNSQRSVRSGRGRRSPSPAQVEAGEAVELGEEGTRDAEVARRLEEALRSIEMPAAPARAARD
ncbi:hypothetical protein CALCODRAFT_95131 [Calocera cornea HHB12733]|uniref:Uncharacterized protein n=1 Tax=Calocera cornea HHB12733 TaxID=1353952 RepID=A0A165IIH4_9BASI|nr:hypothetical protein CALCODRAFT_95131 [Calocera cornea HHB12733]